jgi:hypothetical protein
MSEQQFETTESLQGSDWEYVQIQYASVEEIPLSAGIMLKSGCLFSTMRVYLLSETSEIQEEIKDIVIGTSSILFPTYLIGKKVFIHYERLVKGKKVEWKADEWKDDDFKECEFEAG